LHLILDKLSNYGFCVNWLELANNAISYA
jgi:hypothetical protein